MFLPKPYAVDVDVDYNSCVFESREKSRSDAKSVSRKPFVRLKKRGFRQRTSVTRVQELCRYPGGPRTERLKRTAIAVRATRSFTLPASGFLRRRRTPGSTSGRELFLLSRPAGERRSLSTRALVHGTTGSLSVFVRRSVFRSANKSDASENVGGDSASLSVRTSARRSFCLAAKHSTEDAETDVRTTANDSAYGRFGISSRLRPESFAFYRPFCGDIPVASIHHTIPLGY